MIGVDIVKHSRVNMQIAKKVLTDNEIKQLDDISNKDAKKQYLSSRFAAKEAIIKATNRKFSFKEIEILRTKGAPNVNIKNLELSISHEEDYSVAFCIYKGE